MGRSLKLYSPLPRVFAVRVKSGVVAGESDSDAGYDGLGRIRNRAEETA